jgi:glycosyltransferase involved in cell wall biosynthesis
MSRGILYISYDGMMEPLGQSQVLSYLERLTRDRPIHLVSFEKRDDWRDRARREEVRRRIAAAGIRWHPLRYHKRPSAPATALDIVVGSVVALFLTLRHRLPIVHARSYVAALMALPARMPGGARFLFDMRGLWADERVDAGLWPKHGGLYRFAKAMERRYLERADAVVTLTRASREEIASFPYLVGHVPPITVIPTCADLARFSRRPAEEGQGFIFGFVGAAGTWSLFDEVLAVFTAVRSLRPEVRLLIVNRNEHAYIEERLRHAGIDPDAVELVAAEHKDVPAFISRMTVAAALRKRTYSQIACAPTKLAEYLGCGVPCIVNEGVGDVVEIVEGNRVGVVLHDFTETGRHEAAAALIRLSRELGIRERCVATARALFSLEDGVEAYRRIYDGLTGAEAQAA